MVANQKSAIDEAKKKIEKLINEVSTKLEFKIDKDDTSLSYISNLGILFDLIKIYGQMIDIEEF